MRVPQTLEREQTSIDSHTNIQITFGVHGWSSALGNSLAAFILTYLLKHTASFILYTDPGAVTARWHAQHTAHAWAHDAPATDPPYMYGHGRLERLAS